MNPQPVSAPVLIERVGRSTTSLSFVSAEIAWWHGAYDAPRAEVLT
jgi:hypothetical protein